MHQEKVTFFSYTVLKLNKTVLTTVEKRFLEKSLSFVPTYDMINEAVSKKILKNLEKERDVS